MTTLRPDTQAEWESIQEHGDRFHAGIVFFRYLQPKTEGGQEQQVNQELLKAICDKSDTSDANELLIRQAKMLKDFKNQGYPTVSWKMKLARRLAAGLGIPSMIENGVSLEFIHGCPCIPGSSLKGIAQSYARVNDLHNDLLPFVFGSQKQQGRVAFLDAFPVLNNTERPFEIDIMNPHQGPYYQSGDPPAEYYAPTPIFFLTIKKGIQFQFALTAIELETMNPSIPEALETARGWLEGALKMLGAGGKTRISYGIFS